MKWWRELSLILIIGSWAVFAEETENADPETPRVINEKDIKFLVNPLDIVYEKNPTSKPTTVIIKPAYHYPYPAYPSYPSYPHPTHPTFAPTPTRRPHKPSRPHHHHHHPPPHRPPYGYYPVYVSPTPQPLPTPAPQDPQRQPILLVYGPEYHHHGHHHGHHHHHNNYNYGYPLTENAYLIDDGLEDYDTEDQEDDYEADSRTVSLANDSVEDNGSVAINADYIKLPFGIQLANDAKAAAIDKSSKKFKHQEALIYLKNVKKGRKLEKL